MLLEFNDAMARCYSCICGASKTGCFAWLLGQPPSRRKQALPNESFELEREIAALEEDKQLAEALLAEHKAQRAKLLEEMNQMSRQLESGKDAKAKVQSELEQAKLELEEVIATRDRLKDMAKTEQEELHIAEVELKSATRELDSARAQTLHVGVQVFEQLQKNNMIMMKNDYQHMLSDASAVRAQMLAARKDLDESTNSLKDLLKAVVIMTSSLAKVDYELVTGPAEIVSTHLPVLLGQTSPEFSQATQSPDSSSPPGFRDTEAEAAE